MLLSNVVKWFYAQLNINAEKCIGWNKVLLKYTINDMFKLFYEVWKLNKFTQLHECIHHQFFLSKIRINVTVHAIQINAKKILIIWNILWNNVYERCSWCRVRCLVLIMAECRCPVSPIIATLDQVLEMWKLHPRDVTQTPDGQHDDDGQSEVMWGVTLGQPRR